MKVWYCGNFVDIKIGQKVTVFRCGSGHTTFGEPATLKSTTAQHLVFVTESGAVVKTAKDNLHDVRGRAAAENYGVSLHPFESFEGMIRQDVWFWDKKTCKLVKK